MSKLQRDLQGSLSFVLGISLSSYAPSTIPLILYETVFSLCPCASNPHTLVMPIILFRLIALIALLIQFIPQLMIPWPHAMHTILRSAARYSQETGQQNSKTNIAKQILPCKRMINNALVLRTKGNTAVRIL